MDPESSLHVDEHNKNPARGNPKVSGNQLCQRGTERLALRVRNPDAAQLKESGWRIIFGQDHFGNRLESGHDVTLGFVELRPHNFGRTDQQVISLFVGEGAVRLDGQIGHRQVWPGSSGWLKQNFTPTGDSGEPAIKIDLRGSSQEVQPPFVANKSEFGIIDSQTLKSVNDVPNTH